MKSARLAIARGRPVFVPAHPLTRKMDPMNIIHQIEKFQPIDDLPDDLDPRTNPIICRHWFGIHVDDESGKELTTKSSRTVQRRAA